MSDDYLNALNNFINKGEYTLINRNIMEDAIANADFQIQVMKSFITK